MAEKAKVAITYVKRVTIKNGVRTERELTPEEIKEWAKEHGMIKKEETSK